MLPLHFNTSGRTPPDNIGKPEKETSLLTVFIVVWVFVCVVTSAIALLK